MAIIKLKTSIISRNLWFFRI